MVKSILAIVAVSILIASCSHKITRIGYEKPTVQTSECSVDIEYDKPISSDSNTMLLGILKLGDSGVSTNCNEETAVGIIKKEACAIGANSVIITDQQQPSFWGSTCYRCTATLYKKTQAKEAYNDTTQHTNPTIKPYSNHKETNPIVYVLSYVGGFIVGYALVSLLF